MSTESSVTACVFVFLRLGANADVFANIQNDTEYSWKPPKLTPLTVATKSYFRIIQLAFLSISRCLCLSSQILLISISCLTEVDITFLASDASYQTLVFVTRRSLNYALALHTFRVPDSRTKWSACYISIIIVTSQYTCKRQWLMCVTIWRLPSG
jgi:hypothetical protein